MKKKIIQVTAIDSTMEILLGQLNTLSLKYGYEVIGICSSGDRKKYIENNGVRIININIDRNISPIKNFMSIIKIRKVLKKEKPDILHVHTPIAAVLGRIAGKLANVPIIVYTAHGFYFHENMKPAIYKTCFYIEKYIGRWFTDFIFTQSSEDAKLAQEKGFLQEDKILVIGNGVDIWNKFSIKNIEGQLIKELKNEFNIKKDDIVISFIGRLVKEKGILELLEAFEMIDSTNVKLLVIGDVFQGDRDLACRNKVESFRENKNIIFTGKREDINSLLALSDIFCLPSYREGMPRSIIEAMAMENAVIATNIRGCREEVVDGETGFLVNLNSSSEIKEKIEILLNDRKLLNSMKREGRKRAEELYDEKKVVKKQLDVFEKLLSDKGLT